MIGEGIGSKKRQIGAFSVSGGIILKKAFYHGTILTMEGYPADYLIFDDESGRIEDVGQGLCPEGIEKIDLGGKALLPAFIDSHSHIFALAKSFLEVSLKGACSHKEVFCRIRDFLSENEIEKGEFITASDYDDSLFSGEPAFTAEEIDEYFSEYAVVLIHQSRHFGVLNRLAQEKLSLFSDTGYIAETPFIQGIQKIPMPSPNILKKAFFKAQRLYLSYGITTAQEGMMVHMLFPLYQMFCKEKAFWIDVVGYPDFESFPLYAESFAMDSYQNRFRIGGIKVILDGSPQGKTAWVTVSYTDGNYGTSNVETKALREIIGFASERKIPVLAHGNGDAAIDQFLDVLKEKGNTAVRNVLIHGQLARPDQLKRIKELSVIPSFFVGHVYYWGDVHMKYLGTERAQKISPLASAQKEGILFTLHQDAPVIMPDMLETVKIASQRKTKEGVLLGEEERISVYEALKAVTIYAAYQYGEEDTKGSLAKGKYADFVILSADPLKNDLALVTVEETISRGKTLYRRKEGDFGSEKTPLDGKTEK